MLYYIMHLHLMVILLMQNHIKLLHYLNHLIFNMNNLINNIHLNHMGINYYIFLMMLLHFYNFFIL